MDQTSTDRDKYIALYRAGGEADIAHILCPDCPVEEFESMVSTEEYTKFKDDLNLRFVDNLDAILVGEIYRTLGLLKDNQSGGLKDLSAHFKTMLEMTEPIIRRKAIENKENNVLGSVKLRIEGVDDE